MISSLFVTEATKYCVHGGLQQIKGSLAEKIFARAGARTLDVQVKSLTLYQLSYPGSSWFTMITRLSETKYWSLAKKLIAQAGARKDPQVENLNLPFKIVTLTIVGIPSLYKGCVQ